MRCDGHALTGGEGVAPRLRTCPARPGKQTASCRLHALNVTGKPTASCRLHALNVTGKQTASCRPGRRRPRCWRLAWAPAALLLSWRQRPRLSPAPDGRPAVEPSPGTRLLLYFLLRT
jgi:hypothetical protein